MRALALLASAVTLLGMAISLCGASPESAAGQPLLEMVQARATGESRLEVRIVCRPLPASYRVEQVGGEETGIVAFLPGYRSELPAELTLMDGKIRLRVEQNGEGTRLEIPATGLDLEGVELDDQGLRFSFRMISATNRGPGSGPPPSGPSSSYRVGPGDLISVSVFGHEDLSKDVRVSANGTINFPLLGDMPVAGHTPAEIVALLAESLGRDYVVNPQVFVGVAEYQSQPVNVIGEVQKSGKYFLKGPTTLIDILSEAGGLTDKAGSEIVITRHASEGRRDGGLEQVRVSTETVFEVHDGTQNILLRAGDVVNVPQAPVFYIRGEVNRPGQYPLRADTTIQKAISLAGGFSQWADEKDVLVIRERAGNRKKLNLNLKKISKGENPDVKIEPEDIIVVSRRLL